MLELSIILVLYNCADTLPACLESLGGCLKEGWAEVIAADNASEDDSTAILLRDAPTATLVRLPENRGFAAGINEAVLYARGRYWLLLNPDVTIPEGALPVLTAWMDTHQTLGVASPAIIDEVGTRESVPRSIPSIGRTLLEMSRVHLVLTPERCERLLFGPYWRGGDQFDVGWVPGTAMLVRPEAAQAAGKLREDFFMYGEDIEWCHRIRRAGWRIGVCSTTRFTHKGSASALPTFGEAGLERRMAASTHAAYRAIYGRLRGDLLAALTALASLIESVSPFQASEQRRRFATQAHIWWKLARRH